MYRREDSPFQGAVGPSPFQSLDSSETKREGGRKKNKGQLEHSLPSLPYCRSSLHLLPDCAHHQPNQPALRAQDIAKSHSPFRHSPRSIRLSSSQNPLHLDPVLLRPQHVSVSVYLLLARSSQRLLLCDPPQSASVDDEFLEVSLSVLLVVGCVVVLRVVSSFSVLGSSSFSRWYRRRG